MGSTVSIAFLSDLHFGPDLEVVETPIEYLRKLRRARANEWVFQFVESCCKRHNSNIVKSLPMYLNCCDPVDFFIVAGDLIAAPDSENSYDYLRRYLTTYDDRGVGLGIPTDRLVVIPGNHDKLLQCNLGKYYRGFLAPLGAPLQPKSQGCFFISKRCRGQVFLFALVDANVYQDVAGRFQRTFLARGEITPTLRCQFEAKMKLLEQGIAFDAVTEGVCIDKCAKVLIIHFAADQSKFDLGPVERWVIPHDCKHIRSFLKSSASRFDLIVHGHFHCPRPYAIGRIPVLSIGSTTTGDVHDPDRRPGFFIAKFEGNRLLNYHHHEWTREGFRPDSKIPGKRETAAA